MSSLPLRCPFLSLADDVSNLAVFDELECSRAEPNWFWLWILGVGLFDRALKLLAPIDTLSRLTAIVMRQVVVVLLLQQCTDSKE